MILQTLQKQCWCQVVFSWVGMGLHMKGGVLKEGHGKDDGEITLVNLSYRWRTECEKRWSHRTLQYLYIWIYAGLGVLFFFSFFWGWCLNRDFYHQWLHNKILLIAILHLSLLMSVAIYHKEKSVRIRTEYSYIGSIHHKLFHCKDEGNFF